MEHAMKMRIGIAAMIAAVAFSADAQPEPKFQKLTGAQIQAKFSGMELTDEAHWGEVFERNGTLTITSMGHKSLGKWRTQKDKLLSRYWKRTRRRLLRSLGLREKRRTQKPSLESAAGSRASKADGWQVVDRGLRRR
jgi:hypothetical protein